MANIIIAIFNMSIAGSVIIILTLMARFFLQTLPKKYTYILWGIVCLRLICPYGISFPALLNFLQGKHTGSIITWTEYIPQAIGTTLFNTKNLPVGAIALILTVLSVIWLIGFISLLIYEFIAYNNARKRLMTAIKIQNQVFETDQISAPFIFGLLSPKIYIPIDISEKELEYVLCHEFIHIKRKDNLVKFIQCLVLAFHWFNPFVWLAFKFMSIDMEMSCDEEVIASLGSNTRKEYAKTIFALSQTKIKVTRSMLTFGASDTRIRVNNILNKKKNMAFKVALSVVAAAILTVFLVSNSAVSTIFKITHNSIYVYAVRRLKTTDLSNITADQIEIGARVQDIDLSSYPADRPNITGDYDYFFNQIRIGVNSENKVRSFTAANGATTLSINDHTKISTIDEVTELLGNHYLDKMQDREQGLKKHIYYDAKTGLMAEFIYSNYDGSIAWVTLTLP